MRIKPLLIAAILVATPGLAFATGCNGDNRQAMSCADGMSYDHETGRCVTGVSS